MVQTPFEEAMLFSLNSCTRDTSALFMKLYGY